MDFSNLWTGIDGDRKRASSYDLSGGNRDYWLIEPGESRPLLAHKGAAGAVLRIWFTPNSNDPDYLQGTTFSMQFDGETTVDNAPLGMLAGCGPWAVNDLSSPPVSVMRSRKMNQDQASAGTGSFNLAWCMPFTWQCAISIRNSTARSLMLHFHVDYLTGCTYAAPPLLFHTTHHSRVLTTPWQPTSSSDGGDDLLEGAKNQTNRHNFLLADIDGYQGNYAGTLLAVESHPDRCGKWYEGDDMFFIDGQSWPPALHGTGTEDYFGMAWGVHRRYQSWDHGVTHYERGITDHDRFYDGRFVLYRWHLADPIPFQRSLHASIEAGHANDCAQLYESMAFWYGRKVS